MSQIMIRLLQAYDKQAVMGILRNTPEFLTHEVIVAEELIDSYLKSPGESNFHIMVAEVQKEIAGYVCYGHDSMTRSTWDIYWIAVDKTRKGQGIGGALMKDTESKIKALGGTLIIVETSSKPDYQKTRQFYIDRHYIEIARIPKFYAPDDDKVIYIKSFVHSS